MPDGVQPKLFPARSDRKNFPIGFFRYSTESSMNYDRPPMTAGGGRRLNEEG
jgi:hypothetical protein